MYMIRHQSSNTRYTLISALIRLFKQSTRPKKHGIQRYKVGSPRGQTFSQTQGGLEFRPVAPTLFSVSRWYLAGASHMLQPQLEFRVSNKEVMMTLLTAMRRPAYTDWTMLIVVLNNDSKAINVCPV